MRSRCGHLSGLPERKQSGPYEFPQIHCCPGRRHVSGRFLRCANLGRGAPAGDPRPDRALRTRHDRRCGDARGIHAQYPLWSDGLDKRRWLYLPPGTAIDKSAVDAWEFPRGTRAWKEFSSQGRVETRFIERLADGRWRFASYVWNAAGTEATLAPAEGIAKLGIPSRADCLACHDGAPVPILGYSAVQLALEAIAEPVPGARAVLGYLHGNCGHCHNDAALPALDLALDQRAANPEESAVRSLVSLVGRYSRYGPAGAAETRRVKPGHSGESLLVTRMRSHDPLVRMPPLGVSVADAAGLALIERWIDHDLKPQEKQR